jgi:hypothetical protein
MAVLVEGISVVVRVAAIWEKLPGGWPAFRDSVPNSTLCCDNELARVGFMSPVDVKAFVMRLESRGLVYLQDGKAQDLVVADQRRGLAAPCAWANFGRVNLGGNPDRRVAACQLNDSQQHQVFTPDGWAYEDSLSARYLFVDNRWVPEFMDFLRHDNGLDVYRDLRTGKEVFVGRADA